MLEESEVLRCVLLCLPDVLDVTGVMRCTLLCMLEVMRCMLLRTLDAVEGGLSFRVSKLPLRQCFRYSPPPVRPVEPVGPV